MPRVRRKSHKIRNAIIAIVSLMIIASSVAVAFQMNGGSGAVTETNKVLLVTSMGNITMQLYDDMPITTGNFKNLVKTGAYDGTIFHRVVPGFVVQGGDVTSKRIPVSPIQDELPNKHSNVRGSVAMAKTNSPNSATSQFYINLNDSNAASLDSNYSVFGTVVAGMDVVDKISQVPVNTDSTSPNFDKPLQNVTLISATFIH